MIVNDSLTLGIYGNEPGDPTYHAFHWRVASDARYVARIDQRSRWIWCVIWVDRQVEATTGLGHAILRLQERLDGDAAWLQPFSETMSRTLTLKAGDCVRRLSSPNWRRLGSSFVLRFDPKIGPSEGLLQTESSPEHVLVRRGREVWNFAEYQRLTSSVSQKGSYAR